MRNFNNFNSIKIMLASPERIRSWSRGEVKNAETINYRTVKPVPGGLFCEKIFGPVKDYECRCGKYKRYQGQGFVCKTCGVEVTKSSVRRERIGHIELAAPVVHIWFFRNISPISILLEISQNVLESIIYFSSYIVTDPKNTPLKYKQILSEQEYMDMVEKYGGDSFKCGIGAEVILELLKNINLKKEKEKIVKLLSNDNSQKNQILIKKLKVINDFILSNNKPEWMVLTVLPVIPPELRPIVQLDGDRFAVSDLNDLYRYIVNRNIRLKNLIDISAPEIIIKNEKRMLQEAVDSLLDNNRRRKPLSAHGSKTLKSLTDMLKGKTGRFRQNLLGKRVDYSGRSVIVVGPELKIYQCGLPKEMAVELFKPFIMKELIKRGLVFNVKSAKKMIEQMDTRIWDVLEEIIKGYPVMLNRAPTLHRLGIQAFEPILVEGKAIKLHPLVCVAFNADFDGDQMAVHVPLTLEAQAECKFLLLSSNNLLKPSDGSPIVVPSQDMVLGIYYLTKEKKGAIGEGKFFKNFNEAILAFDNKYIHYHTRIKVRVTKKISEDKVIIQNVESTYGRFLFNSIIPQNLGFVDRSIPGNELKLEIDKVVKKEDLKNIVKRVFNIYGNAETIKVLDNIKDLGYKYSTLAACTISIADMAVPKTKQDILNVAQGKVDKISNNYELGLLTEEEKYHEIIKIWDEADSILKKELLSNFDDFNNINMMVDSGARGSSSQVKQLVGMRGLMVDTSGKIIELPIKSNFREGLDVLEYFISAHGARKGLTDVALKTADSGYLTRRLVDVSHDVIINEDDCCLDGDEIPGTYVTELYDGKNTAIKIESLEDRIIGRFIAEKICSKDGKVIINANELITPEIAAKIIREGVDKDGNNIGKLNSKGVWTGVGAVKIRSVLTCKSKNGVCTKCYGLNIGTGKKSQIGEVVGIMAAQSIGEPGTQLTMRNFHTGGVAGEDITQGLPRVQELFEVRKPKGLAIISEISGNATLEYAGKGRFCKITVENNKEKQKKIYNIQSDLLIIDSLMKKFEVKKVVKVEAGEQLTRGNLDLREVLAINGRKELENYIIKEIQKVYKIQGIDINDKHIEIILRQMMKKIKVEDIGDSKYSINELVDNIEFEETNKQLRKENKKEAKGSIYLLSITKAALYSNSFLSASSFQETSKVLAKAAIKGKIDKLVGIKENVLIGKLIPAGTGMKKHRKVNLDTDETISDQIEDIRKTQEEILKKDKK